MKKHIQKIIFSPFFSGTMVMIIGSNSISALNYIYHLFMGRLLGVASYGELASLISLMGLLGMVPTSLGLVITKFISSAKDEKEINDLIIWFNRRVFVVSLMLVLVVSLSSYWIANFLNIKNYLTIVIIAFSYIFSLFAVYYRSVLQGLLKFKELVFSLFVETGTKLVLGIGLVYLGFSVLGALYGLVIGIIVGFLITKNSIGKLVKVDQSNFIEGKQILAYSIPVLVQSFAATALYTSDLILVKHFFSTTDAGLYAAISTLGRIILFGSGPIAAVMFPMVAKKKNNKENYISVFLYSLGLTLLFAACLLVVYYFLPSLAINLLYGKSYLGGSSLLFLSGLFITLYTLCFMFISFFLSIGITRIIVLPVVAALVQIIGIWFIHSSLMDVLIISISVCTLLLICLIVYFTRKIVD